MAGLCHKSNHKRKVNRHRKHRLSQQETGVGKKQGASFRRHQTKGLVLRHRPKRRCLPSCGNPWRLNTRPQNKHNTLCLCLCMRLYRYRFPSSDNRSSSSSSSSNNNSNSNSNSPK